MFRKFYKSIEFLEAQNKWADDFIIYYFDKIHERHPYDHEINFFNGKLNRGIPKIQIIKEITELPDSKIKFNEIQGANLKLKFQKAIRAVPLIGYSLALLGLRVEHETVEARINKSILNKLSFNDYSASRMKGDFSVTNAQITCKSTSFTTYSPNQKIVSSIFEMVLAND